MSTPPRRSGLTLLPPPPFPMLLSFYACEVGPKAQAILLVPSPAPYAHPLFKELSLTKPMGIAPFLLRHSSQGVEIAELCLTARETP